MISTRSIAVFLIACGAILMTIAVERYYSAIATAKAIAAQFEEIKFESASLPTVSAVCGLAAVVMLVAGVRLLFESRHQSQETESGLLKQ